MDHTPTPWFLHDFSDPAVSSSPGPGDVTISCDHPATITVACMGNALTGTIEEARANAALIVRRVNSHDELLEAVLVALPYVEDNLANPEQFKPGVVRRHARQLRAAIAKAEGR